MDDDREILIRELEIQYRMLAELYAQIRNLRWLVNLLRAETGRPEIVRLRFPSIFPHPLVLSFLISSRAHMKRLQQWAETPLSIYFADLAISEGHDSVAQLSPVPNTPAMEEPAGGEPAGGETAAGETATGETATGETAAIEATPVLEIRDIISADSAVQDSVEGGLTEGEPTASFAGERTRRECARHKRTGCK